MTKADDEEAERNRAAERELARLGLVERIEARMKLLGLNPFSAAKKAGLGGDYVRDIIRGRVRNPSVERLGKLAQALECSLQYLFGLDEIEFRTVSYSPNRDPEEIPPPPTPLPIWRPTDGKPGFYLLPIKYELIADAFRKATDVVRTPLGFEAATIPLAYIDRDSWWEIVRDDTVARVAPPGSLVQVVEMHDEERNQIAHGDFVIVVKRMVGPDASFNLIERSIRQVIYRYPDLGLWFLEYAYLDPEMNLSDEIWREGEPTAPRRTLDEIAMEIEDPQERERALAQNQMLRDALAKRARSEPASAETQKALDRMNNPEWQRDIEAKAEQLSKWRPKLVGKVIRVLTPLDPRAGFWMGSENTGVTPK